MDNCIFCKIISRESPSDFVYEDDDVFVFLSNKPVVKGHTLVIPKKHSNDFLDTEDEVLAKTIVEVKRMANAVLETTGSKGFNLHVNVKSVAGQEVFHLHYHIIPRFEKDGLKNWEGSLGAPVTRQELANEIKKHINK